MWRAKRKRSVGRRLLKTAGILLVLVLLVLLALPYLVNLEKYRTIIAEELSRQLGRPVQVTALRLRVIPNVSLEIQGLRILDRPGFGRQPALTADALRARVRLLPLLQKKLQIQSVRLERPVLVLRRDRAGFNNLLAPRPSPSAAKPFTPAPPGGPPPPAPSAPEAPAELSPPLAGLLIGNLDIEDAEFRIEDPTIGAPIVLRGINVRMSQPSPEETVQVRLRTQAPVFQVNAQIGPIDWKDTLATPAEGSLVIGKGWMNALRPWLDRRLRGSALDLSEAELSGEIRARGSLQRAEIKGDLSVQNVKERARPRARPGAPDLDLQLKSNLKVSRREPGSPLTFEADGAIGIGRLLFHVTGQGAADSEHLRFQSEVQGARVQGSDLMPLLRIALGEQADALKLDGLVGFHLKARREKETTSVVLSLDGRNAQAGFGTAFRKPAGVPLKLSATTVVSPGGLEVNPFSLELRQIRFQGSLRQTDGTLSLQGETGTFPLEGLETLFPAAAPWGLAGTTRIGIVANGKVEDILRQRLQIQVTLEDGAASFPALAARIRNLRGFALLTPRSVQISRTHARIGQSEIKLEAQLVDFAAPRIRFDLRLPSFRLEDFLPPSPTPQKSGAALRAPFVRKASWPPGEPGRRPGPEPLRLSQSGPSPAPSLLKHAQAEGTLRVGQGEAKGIHFQNLSADVRLRDEKLRAERVRADLYGGALEGAGEYALDRRPGPFRARLTLKGVRAEKALADRLPGPPVLSGRADLTGEFEGAGFTREVLERALSGKGEITVTDGEIRKLEFLGEVEKVLKMEGLFGLQDGKKRFDRLAGPFEIRKGKVILPNLRLTSSGLSMQAAGEVDLNLRSQLTVTAQFDDKASRRLSRSLLGALMQPGERLEIPFRIRGPLASPQVSLDPRFLEKRLRQDPGKVLKDALERLLR